MPPRDPEQLHAFLAKGRRPRPRFGAFFREHRLALGKSLREFAAENGLDAGNISRLERGVFLPPQSEKKLREYAKALQLKAGSDDWMTFFDLAAAESGRIPREILENEELRAHLPILFRTLRGQRVPKERLDALIRLIKENAK